MAIVVVMTRTCSELRHVRVPDRTRRVVRARTRRQALLTRTRTSPQPRSRRSHARLVADTTHGHDDLRLLRIVLDLRAQPLHVDVDETGVRRVPVAPDLLE